MTMFSNNKFKENNRIKDFICIFIILLSCIFYEFGMKLFQTGSLTGDYGDGAYSVMYNAFKGFSENKINFWLPNLCGGIPAVGNTLVLSLYPLHWLAVKLNGNDVGLLILGISHCLHLFIFGLGIFVFLRILHFDRKISLVTVLLLAFSCEIPRQSMWIYLFTGFAWFPLIVDSLLLLTRNKRKLLYICIGGGCLGMSGLGNQGQTLLINMLITFSFWVFYCLQNFKNRKQILSYTKSVMVLGVLGAFLCAPALLPAIEFTKNAVRYVPYMGFLHSHERISLNEFNRYSIGADSLGALFQYPFTTLNGYYSFSYFPFLASVFCVLGFFVKKQENLVKRFCSGMLVFCICYSTGFVLPLIFCYIPYFNGIREPFLYIPYVSLPFAYFFAVGIKNSQEYLLDFKGTVYKPLFVLFALLVVFASVLWPYNFKHYIFRQNLIIALLLVVSVLLCLLFIKYKKQNLKYILFCFALCCVLVQLKVTFDTLQLHHRIISLSKKVPQVEKLIGNLESVKLSKQNHTRHRHWTDEKFYPSNIMAHIDAFDTSGYVNPIPRQSYLARGLGHKQASLLQNVEFFHTQTDSSKIHYQQLEQSGIPYFKEEAGCSDLGDNTQSSKSATWRAETLGTAWFVYDCKEVKDISELTDAEILNALNSRADYKDFAFVKDLKDFKPQKSRVNRVELQEYNNDSIKLKVATDNDGILCTSELFYPGWNVYIDGKKSECLQVNYLFRGVRVRAGEHIVEFKYLPKAFVVGTVLFFCAIFFILFFLIKTVCFSKSKRLIYINAAECILISAISLVLVFASVRLLKQLYKTKASVQTVGISDDKWILQHASFSVTTSDEKNCLRFSFYNPAEVEKLDRTIDFYIDGRMTYQCKIQSGAWTYDVPLESEDSFRVEIKTDYIQPLRNGDIRPLSVVLADVNLINAESCSIAD